jgi:tight adherence protein C
MANLPSPAAARELLLTVLPGVAVLFCAGLGLLFGAWQREGRIEARLRSLHGERPARPAVASLAAQFKQAVTALGGWILRSGLLPARTQSELQHTLASAGLSASNGLALFLGGKILLALCLPLLVWLLARDGLLPGRLALLGPAVCAVGGLLLPDWLLRRHRRGYLKRLEAGLPDALDMLVICTQAGIGMGSAIVQVGTELRQTYPEISRELLETAQEMQLASDSRVALLNIGSRTGLDSLRRFATGLVQAQQYGTPLTQALQMLSAELRAQTLTRMEAAAARLGVMLTLPTVIFILPCVFIVAGGPAAIQLMQNLNLGH